jgi:hypothetical protein
MDGHLDELSDSSGKFTPLLNTGQSFLVKASLL